jgi:hypothetical protein
MSIRSSLKSWVELSRIWPVSGKHFTDHVASVACLSDGLHCLMGVDRFGHAEGKEVVQMLHWSLWSSSWWLSSIVTMYVCLVTQHSRFDHSWICNSFMRCASSSRWLIHCRLDSNATSFRFFFLKKKKKKKESILAIMMVMTSSIVITLISEPGPEHHLRWFNTRCMTAPSYSMLSSLAWRSNWNRPPPWIVERMMLRESCLKLRRMDT